MEENLYTYLLAFSIFVSTLIYVSVFSLRQKLSLSNSFTIAVAHTVYCIYYYFYSFANPADAKAYYFKAVSGEELSLFGSGFVVSLIHVLTAYGGFSYLNTFLFFNFIGLVGLLHLYYCLKYCSREQMPALSVGYLVVLLLPGLHFWTVAPGKDAIAFAAGVLFVTAELTKPKPYYYQGFAIIMMAFVRPHIAALMLASLFIVEVFFRERPLRVKIVFIASSIVVFLSSIDFLIAYVRLESLNVELVSAGLSAMRETESVGGGAMGNQNSSIIFSMLMYLFGPLPGMVPGLLGLASSIDGLILLCFLVVAIAKRGPFLKACKLIPASVLFFVMSWLLLAFVTYNFGIVVRQRWMILPVVWVLVFMMLNGVSGQNDQQDCSSYNR